MLYIYIIYVIYCITSILSLLHKRGYGPPGLRALSWSFVRLSRFPAICLLWDTQLYSSACTLNLYLFKYRPKCQTNLISDRLWLRF